MHDPSDIAIRVVRALLDAHIECAIGGALALGRWVRPRSTLDADINIFADEQDYESALDALESAGVELDRGQALRRFAQGHVAIGRLDGVRVDLFVPSIPFYEDARKTVSTLSVDGFPVPFLSAEALAVFKLLFFRRKDVHDLETLADELSETLDTAWIRAHVAAMMGEDDERVAEWDRICDATKEGL